MNKYDSIDAMKYYLQKNNIDYLEDIYDGTQRITMVYNSPKSPGSVIESCIYFLPDCIESRVYYSKIGSELIKNSNHKSKSELMRLLNFLNSNVWVSSSDGVGGALYTPEYLHTPRFYMTEDGNFDLTATTFIQYHFYELTKIQTADYLTAALPVLMDELSTPIWGVVIDMIPLDQAIRYIKKNILNEREEIKISHRK